MTNSLTELLREFDGIFPIFSAESATRAFITRAHAIGVAEGQDKTIYAMDEQAKEHWFNEGKVAERRRIFEGLRGEDGADNPSGGFRQGFVFGWNSFRKEVLHLLEGEKSSEVRDGQ